MKLVASWMLTILHKHEQHVEQAMYLSYVAIRLPTGIKGFKIISGLLYIEQVCKMSESRE